MFFLMLFFLTDSKDLNILNRNTLTCIFFVLYVNEVKNNNSIVSGVYFQQIWNVLNVTV